MNKHLNVDTPLGPSEAQLFLVSELESHLELGSLESVPKVKTLKLVIALMNAGGKTKRELAKLADDMIEAVASVDRVLQQNLAGAKDEVNGLKDRITRLEIERAAPPVSLADIAAELERRAQERVRVSGPQEELENERAHLIEKRDHARSAGAGRAEIEALDRRIETLTSTIDSILKATAENDREVMLIKRYRDAVTLVAQGLPKGIIGRSPPATAVAPKRLQAAR